MWKYVRDFLSSNLSEDDADEPFNDSFANYLSGQERSMVRRLAFSTLRLSGMHSMGTSASRYYGAGLEFDSVREYDVGDDVRRLDWNVTARTGRLHTKVFTEDRSLNVCTVVHLTPTMMYTTTTRTKAEVAVKFARLVNELVRFQNDFFSSGILTHTSFQFFKPSHNASSWARFYSCFLSCVQATSTQMASNSLRETSIRMGLKVSQHLPAGSIMILVSDFLDDDVKVDLVTLKRKYDLIVVRVLDRTELRIPNEEVAQPALMDFNRANHTKPVRLSFAESINLTLARENERFVQFCKNEGIDFLELDTDTIDLVSALEKLLKKRKPGTVVNTNIRGKETI